VIFFFITTIIVENECGVKYYFEIAGRGERKETLNRNVPKNNALNLLLLVLTIDKTRHLNQKVAFTL